MDTPTTEQDLRREAIRRHLSGEKPRTIYEDLERSPRWFDKWWAEYRHHPWTDFADHSRAPMTSPSQTPEAVVQAIVAARRTLEAATTPDTRYGLIGARAIQTHLEGLGIDPPSTATIQRTLQAHDLTHPMGAGHDSAFYPWLEAWAVNAIHATDIITKHIRGGEVIENLHTMDHYSHAAYLSQHAAKSSGTICEHLVAAWSKLGLPQLQQFDNEDTFRGGHTHARVIGRVVRLCLRLWRVALKSCSRPFMKRNGITRSKPFIVFGTKPFGHGTRFGIGPRCNTKPHCSSAGITRSIVPQPWRARPRPRCGRVSRWCA